MRMNVVLAIFKRNIVSYFNNPTGYVFICVFVLLNAVAAFWPNEFFNANLANLDQLNRYLPYIMLVFIPAITMSIWAEERRQGTDELLLTIPAGDLDVVLGKYLAALAIFTAALVYSLCWNLGFLMWYGDPDFGLFIGSAFGYWLTGAAMLSVGMVASFLTSNLTVGFVLGAVFNVPLVFASFADSFLSKEVAEAVSYWSLSSQFSTFGRGVISLAGLSYFIMIIVVMLYLSMVLIGRRHWLGGRDGAGLGGHYCLRALCLVGLAAGITATIDHKNSSRTRLDVTSEQLSRLSDKTLDLVRTINPKRPIQIEAYISTEVPETFVPTRLDLLTLLKEFEAMSDGKVRVQIHATDALSEAAERAEEQYGIGGRRVVSMQRGAMKEDTIYMAVAMTSGLNKVIVPFFERGVRVEYELIRSICTVSEQTRKRVGVLQTDAKLFGGFDTATFTPTQSEELINELKKQYEVVEVNPDTRIDASYDVLLAVQPSSLSPEQMDNFLEVVRSGQPTAIFEDPFPFMFQNVTATSAPRRPAQQNPMMGMGQPPAPKATPDQMEEMWHMLGVDFSATKVIWQDYNPFPKWRFEWPKEFISIDKGANGGDSTVSLFNQEDTITSGLQQILFLYPGSIRRLNDSTMKFMPLVKTGNETGTELYSQILDTSNPFGPPRMNPNVMRNREGENYVLAAHIRGKPSSRDGGLGGLNLPMSDESADDETEETADTADDDTADQDASDGEAGDSSVEEDSAAATDEESDDDKSTAKTKKPARRRNRELNVVLVSDIDVLSSVFHNLRNQGRDPNQDVGFDLDNVTFVLNTLDVLAKDERFVDIRKRRTKHRTLDGIQSVIDAAEAAAAETRDKFDKDFVQAQAKAQKKFDDDIEKMRKRNANEIEIEVARSTAERRLQVEAKKLEKNRDKQRERIERELALTIRVKQNSCKAYAVVWPPVLLVVAGMFVFFNRRANEREGVSRARLR